MESWSLGQRWRYGARQAAGLGALAGVSEAAVLGLRGVGGLSAVEVAGLGGLAALLMAVVGAGLGLLAGPVHTLRPDEPAYRNLAAQLGLAGGLLLGLYLWPWSATLVAEDRVAAGVAMALLPLGTAAVLFVNARFWLARVETGRAPPVGWWVVVAALGLVGLVAGAAGAALRDTGGRFALGGDPNVLLVTVDGLRHDDVGPAMPRLARLAEQATWFDEAITPSTSSVAAHGTLLTGLHPLRHRAFDDMHALPGGWTTLPEAFEKEGFATGAFVSSAVVSGVGLDQGFRVFDDALSPLGLGQLGLMRLVAPGRWVRRGPDQTSSRFVSWLSAHASWPFVGWVQLEVRDEADRAAVDEALGRVVDALQATGAADRTLLVVCGSVGRTTAGPFGLSDAMVRVPLVVRAPGRGALPRVDAQVRLMDVPMTALAWARLDRADEAEGIDLLGFWDGRRDRGIWTALIGRDAQGAALVGVRQDGVKVVLEPAIDEELVFDLTDDPQETTNLAVEQPELLDKARGLLGPDLRALERLVNEMPELGSGRRARLAALGLR